MELKTATKYVQSAMDTYSESPLMQDAWKTIRAALEESTNSSHNKPSRPCGDCGECCYQSRFSSKCKLGRNNE